jgi:hypothetical protein
LAGVLRACIGKNINPTRQRGRISFAATSLARRVGVVCPGLFGDA